MIFNYNIDSEIVIIFSDNSVFVEFAFVEHPGLPSRQCALNYVQFLDLIRLLRDSLLLLRFFWKTVNTGCGCTSCLALDLTFIVDAVFFSFFAAGTFVVPVCPVCAENSSLKLA